MAALWILSFGAVLNAEETPRTGIIDRAGVVDDATETRINGWLLELETKTGAQLKVLTIDTLEGRDIQDYAIETAKRWQLGQKQEDNGTLVVVAVKDRKWRIETGEGIEDTLPDAFCDHVASDYFLPNFRRGDFGKGILDGTAVLAQKVAADANVQLTGVPNLSLRGRGGREKIFGVCSVSAIVLLFVFIAIMRNGIARQRYRRGGWDMGDLITSAMLGRMLLGGRGRGRWSGGSSWGGFGGFSGGGGFGGGGFGGGGGGSFGGGGAGGSW